MRTVFLFSPYGRSSGSNAGYFCLWQKTGGLEVPDCGLLTQSGGPPTSASEYPKGYPDALLAYVIGTFYNLFTVPLRSRSGNQLCGYASPHCAAFDRLRGKAVSPRGKDHRQPLRGPQRNGAGPTRSALHFQSQLI